MGCNQLAVLQRSDMLIQVCIMLNVELVLIRLWDRRNPTKNNYSSVMSYLP